MIVKVAPDIEQKKSHIWINEGAVYLRIYGSPSFYNLTPMQLETAYVVLGVG